MNGVRGPTTRRERSGLARVRSQLTVLGDTFVWAAAASASVPKEGWRGKKAEKREEGGWSDHSSPLVSSGVAVFFWMGQKTDLKQTQTTEKESNVGWNPSRRPDRLAFLLPRLGNIGVTQLYSPGRN